MGSGKASTLGSRAVGSPASNPTTIVSLADGGILASLLRAQLLPPWTWLLVSKASGSHSSTAESEPKRETQGSLRSLPRGCPAWETAKCFPPLKGSQAPAPAPGCPGSMALGLASHRPLHVKTLNEDVNHCSLLGIQFRDQRSPMPGLGKHWTSSSPRARAHKGGPGTGVRACVVWAGSKEDQEQLGLITEWGMMQQEEARHRGCLPGTGASSHKDISSWSPGHYQNAALQEQPKLYTSRTQLLSPAAAL